MVSVKQQSEVRSGEASRDGVRPSRALSPRVAMAGAVVTAGLLTTGGILWWFGREDDPTFGEQFRIALALLDEDVDPAARRQAAEIASRLEAAEYRDPEFGGGVEFILGLVAFRNAEESRATGSETGFELAVRYLEEALRRALPQDRRPEWAFALGTSLHRIGRPSEARPLLEEAATTYTPARVPATLTLAEIYFDLKTPETLEAALGLTGDLLHSGELDRPARVQTHMLRAQLLLALERYGELDRELQALQTVSPEDYASQSTVVFRGQSLLAADRFAEALALLQPVANHAGLDATSPRRASYLIGVVYEEMGRSQDAVRAFSRTADRYAGSHESLAANLRMADLLRTDEQHEQARDAYRRALRMVQRPRDFRNRWLTLEEFRHTIGNAWNEWCNDGGYNWAIDLTKEMQPLFSEEEARELEAHTNRLWSEHLQRELDFATFSKRTELAPELHRRCRETGAAYAALARTVRTSSRYPDALWHSAEFYYQGRDFEQALAQLTRFINTGPKKRLPLALVRRGQTLMDLERFDDALEHFLRVVENHATDPAAFEARYLIGACHVERNQLDQAEQAWRGLLESDDLRPGTEERPGAKEWRQALFALGRLLYYRAELLWQQANRRDDASPGVADDSEQTAEAAFQLWSESGRRLEEFLQRYPQDVHATEARYLLAKSYQNGAELPKRKYESAETENARQELRRTMHAQLQEALREFQLLEQQLLQGDAHDRLDTLERRLLRDGYFEIARTYLSLERYEEAILAYSTAANKFPEDSQVLLAYVQMSNCYNELGKPQEARSMLEQAKVIISQLPDDAFDTRRTNMSKSEWDGWLDWSRQLRQTPVIPQLALP